MKNKKRQKYATELEKIKKLKTLDNILKRSDVESALLANAAKESEPVSENLIDSILNEISKEKDGERNLEIIEKLTIGKKGSKISKDKKIKVRRRGKKVKIKRRLHLVKKKAKKSKTVKKRKRR